MPIPGTIAVPAQHKLNEGVLLSYLREKLPEIFEKATALQLSFFEHGQSNPTYHVIGGTTEVVVRKQPPGALLPGAHNMLREYSITHALWTAGVPVARPYLYCDDKKVVGTSFYVAEYAVGRIFRKPAEMDVAPLHRRNLWFEGVRTLAKVHKADWKNLPLQQFTKSASVDYLERQLKTWFRQYKLAEEHAGKQFLRLPELERLKAILESNKPGPNTVKNVLVHGDYRIDNVIFHPVDSTAVAVLDWELWTVGHGFADLANYCLGYYLSDAVAAGIIGSMDKSLPPGMPPVEETVQFYCKEMGIETISERDWNLYLAFVFFKLSAVLHGVYTRELMGQSTGTNARSAGEQARAFAKQGLEHIRKADAAKDAGERLKDYPQEKLMGLIGKYYDRVLPLKEKLEKFMEEEIYPAEKVFVDQLNALPGGRFSDVPPIMEKLKASARSRGLWNLFFPHARDGAPGLSNVEYGILCEVLGRSGLAPEATNSSAPDTGNMEVLAKYGNEAQQQTWLTPLLNGEIRSAFAMTEPAVASSDATNICTQFIRDGDNYIVNGRKWWTSGAAHPLCKLYIVMGKVVNSGETPDRHAAQTMLLVPADADGIEVVRWLPVFGYDDAPHGHSEVVFKDVRVNAKDALLLGEGRGFEIAQGRLGPGRIHHCMRCIGMAQRCYEAMVKRSVERVAFGKRLIEHGATAHAIAESRIDIESSRLMVLKAALEIDMKDNKAARMDVAMIKVAVPRAALRVIDRAIQVHGGGGVSNDFILAKAWAGTRTLRLADGPDDVHLSSLAKGCVRELRSKL